VLRALVVAAAAAVVLSGCSGPDLSGPEDAATSFARAVADADGARACALLADEVSAELADTAGAPCDQAVLRQSLPAPAAVRRAERYGRQALVVTGTDTVFLSEFPAGWKIIGAGCEPRGDRPYDCAVSGG
jgi:hypothetical protein